MFLKCESQEPFLQPSFTEKKLVTLQNHPANSVHIDGVIPAPELHADFFSHHACPVERAVFLLWRSTKQVGIQIVVPPERYQVY